MPLAEYRARDPAAHVLVVTNMWPTDERLMSGIFIKRQVEALKEAGVRCDVLVVNGHRSPLAYARAAAQLLLLNLRPRGYRLVHANGGETALPARCYLRAPLIVSYCGSDLLGATDAHGVVPPAWRVRRTIAAGAALLARRITVRTREMAQRIPRPVRGRVSVVPAGVDRSAFVPGDKVAARAELGWPAERRIVLFAADPNVALKRHWLAEEAVAYAAARLPEVVLQVAHGLQPSRMPLLMSAADCLICTSATEGSPNVVKEALACDLPVVSTAVGDVPELLADIEDCHVCDADPAALGAALVSVLDPPRRCDGRSRTAHLSKEAIAARMLGVYESATGDGLREAVLAVPAVEGDQHL